MTPVSVTGRANPILALRAIADQAFSRAGGAPLIAGNRARLLDDASENYPAWLEAIASARRHVHLESYIIHDDNVGQRFAEALISKAKEGIAVRLIYDWLGCFGKASAGFWSHLRDGGVEVRCFNPPEFASPLGWLTRDHRKMIVVDGEVGFVTGLCIGQKWEGNPARQIPPWRDTGVALRGPIVAEIEQAFEEVWAALGERLPEAERPESLAIEPAGGVDARIIAGVPGMAEMFRVDQLVAALARERLWLRDAYYVATIPHVQALRAAAQDGVDVRLLLPHGTDIPVLRPLSRAGYRPLLEAGVRVFEWNGPMMHAKTAVADGLWSRIGSSNLNIASWLGNWELDAVIEDEDFGQEMEASYLRDLEHATEVVLDLKQRIRAPGLPRARRWLGSGSRGGSAGRAAAGAVRLGNAIGAVFRRKLEPVDSRIMLYAGCTLIVLAILFAIFPIVLVIPVVAFMAWFGSSLIYRGWRRLRRREGGPQEKVGQEHDQDEHSRQGAGPPSSLEGTRRAAVAVSRAPPRSQ